MPRPHSRPMADSDDVHGADHLSALALELLDRHQRVDRLAGLADGDVQRVRVHHRRAVPELAGGLGVGRDAGELLDDHRAHLGGVVGRAAAEELDLADRTELAGVQVDAAEPCRGEAIVEPAPERAAQRVRLLVDLLAHVVLVRAELVVVGVRVDGHRGLRGTAGFPSIKRRRAVVGRADRRDLAVLQVNHLAGVADQRGHVGGDEHLVLAEAKHDRAAVAGDDELVGVLRVQDDEAVGALDATERADDRVFEAAGAAPVEALSAAASSAAIRWASASVSVSETRRTPLAWSCSRSCSAFSMMPLCTTAIRPAASTCGWALTSFGSPCVAQRV